MNPIVFTLHYSRGGNIVDLPPVLLTFVIVGSILIMFGILANILHIKFSQGFWSTPIHWTDIKPNINNTWLGCLCGLLGGAFIAAAVLIGLVVYIYWGIISL